MTKQEVVEKIHSKLEEIKEIYLQFADKDDYFLSMHVTNTGISFYNRYWNCEATGRGEDYDIGISEYHWEGENDD